MSPSCKGNDKKRKKLMCDNGNDKKRSIKKQRITKEKKPKRGNLHDNEKEQLRIYKGKEKKAMRDNPNNEQK